MVMPLSGSFDYVATVPRSGAPWHAELHPDDRAARDEAHRRTKGVHPELVDPFLGPEPAVEIAGGKIILAKSHAVEVDAAMLAGLGPGDVLRITRTLCAGMGVGVFQRRGLLRRLQLVAAAGAVHRLVTGPLTVRSREAPAEGGAPPRAGRARWHKQWLVEIGTDRETRALRDGEEGAFGDYGVVVVSTFKSGMPGTDECVAVFLVREGLRDAVLGSARLLASGRLRGLAGAR
jgi:hypothetical protein